MASVTPNNGRNRRRKNSWWDGQCTALALILAVLLLVLFGILLKQHRLPWQQGGKPGTETEAPETAGTKPVEIGSETGPAEETETPESGGAQETESAGESSAAAETIESAESGSEGTSESAEASSGESSSAAESSSESAEASTEESTEESKPARKVSDYGPGSHVDSEALQELGTSAFFSQSEIKGSVKDRIYGKSYKDNPNISMSDLRYIRVLYYDYSGTRRVGELVSNKAISGDLVEIFRDLYEAEYPIDKMKLVDDYDASDDWSSSENNTSCFNFRTVGNSSVLSNHALGMAVDINPLYSPEVVYDSDGNVLTVSPKEGEASLNREGDGPYMIHKGDEAYRLFTEHGFTWGGDWKHGKRDYMHFEKALR